MEPEAIILCGGLGTRLRPAIGTLPKSLAPVAGKPFLHHILAMLAQKGIKRVILATGYKGDLVRDAVGETFGTMEIAYSQESSPLGTGGALALALTRMHGRSAVALNGDTWVNMDFQPLAAIADTGELAIAAQFMNDTGRYGRLRVENSRVSGLMEKTGNEPGWINAGCYGIPHSLLSLLPAGRPFSFEKDFLPDYLATRGARMIPVADEFIDIGIPDDYARFAQRKEQDLCE